MNSCLVVSAQSLVFLTPFVYNDLGCLADDISRKLLTGCDVFQIHLYDKQDLAGEEGKPHSGGQPERTEPHLRAEERTDEVLMAEVSRGRDAALAEIVRRYQHDIYRFCLHYVKDAESAREMAQETFIRVYTASGRFDVSRKFKPWILCIARNLCLNELKRKRAMPMETLEAYASDARDESGEVMRYSGSGPDEQLMNRERLELLDKALRELGEEARELVMLRFFERLPAKEIAEILGGTDGSIRTKLHRVLVALREQYAVCKDDL